MAGNWETGWNAPITEQYLWSFPIRDFEIDHWRMMPVSGIKNKEREVDLVEFHTQGELLDTPLPRIFLEPRIGKLNQDSTWLSEFEHPESCMYVFGSAHKDFTSLKRDGDTVVSIDTVQDKGVLWSPQCLAVVLYDRLVKRGDNNTR